jgi:hypothetical protein
MRKPNESLDDFMVKVQETDVEPPRAVTLRSTGEVEVLKPLAVFDFTAKREAVADDSAPLGLSWFHRSLVAGGAFAIVAIVLASAIFIAMYDGNESTEVSEASEVAGVPEATVASDVPDAATGPSTADISTNAELSDASMIRTPQSALRNQEDSRSAVRTRKPRRQPLRSQYTASDFTPTTLVIYIEKGQIKTRIEPQLTADKKPQTFSN